MLKTPLNPKKSLGQHFLTDNNILSKIIQVTELSKDDYVLEIGAGTGLLSERLAPVAKKLVLIEYDKSLINQLEDLKGHFENIEIIKGDVLRLDLKEIFKEHSKWKIVANIPYQITGPLFAMLLFNYRDYLTDIYVMIQDEVARRLCARPKSKEYGKLTLLTQFYSDPKILFKVKPTSFHPPPKVNSAFVHLKILTQGRHECNNELLIKIIKTAFSKRRKQIHNCLTPLFGTSEKAIIHLNEAGINPNDRPQDLRLIDFVNLTNLAFS